MAATDADEPSSSSLKPLKTCVLRVSVHCEGCKKRVTKILRQVEGVLAVEIDIRQQKATVIGDVEPGILLKKLTKSGKHAQLWPQMADPTDPRSAKAKNKEKLVDPANRSRAGEADRGKGRDANKEINEPAKAEAVVFQESAKQGDVNGVSGGDEGKERVGSKNTAGAVHVVKESNSEGKKPETGSEGKQSPPPAAEKNAGENDACPEKTASAGDGGKKKKKKKGQNRNITEGEPSDPPPAEARMESAGDHNGGPRPVPFSANHGPPRHLGPEHYQPHYYSPPAPAVYSVSYNTAFPTQSYSAAYYASPRPATSYAYAYGGSEMASPPAPPALDLEHYARQPLDSFEMFSDENPNGCTVM